MGGAILQLAAVGVQDIYLTGNPQITFFKMVYKRHTNFAIEEHKLEFNGEVNFGKKVSCNIGRLGDLLSNVFLHVELPVMTKKFLNIYDSNYKNGIQFKTGDEKRISELRINPDYLNQHKVISWTNSIGHALIDYVTVEIGGQEIDRQYGEWLEIWDELTIGKCKSTAYNKKMIGKYNRDNWYTEGIYNNALNQNLCIPLNFWFCRNIGLSLPLVALQYHDVKMIVKFNTFDNCWSAAGMDKNKDLSDLQYTPPEEKNITRASLLCNYIYLDTEERKKFAQNSHEYLIDQIQYNDPITSTCNIKDISINLNFNHPIKELIWVGQRGDVKRNNDWFNYSASQKIIPQINETDLDKIICNSSNKLYINYLNSQTETSIQGMLYKIKANILKSSQIYPNNSDEYDSLSPPINSAVLQINGMDRFTEQSYRFFDTIQPYIHHSCIPEYGNIYTYSFALTPEKMEPTGSCNFSRVDNATLYLKINDICYCTGKPNEFVNIRVYAINYNILRIMSGMGGIAYSN